MNRWIIVSVVAIAILGGILGMQFSSVDRGSEGRWYSEEQVKRGAPLYQATCSGCHGPDAASTPEWRTPNEQGHYPPPPLNGTAHAWHHSLDLLRKTVREGGAPIGGSMPPFRDLLSDEETDSILAWVQSHWSDEIYQRWMERNQS